MGSLRFTRAPHDLYFFGEQLADALRRRCDDLASGPRRKAPSAEGAQSVEWSGRVLVGPPAGGGRAVNYRPRRIQINRSRSETKYKVWRFEAVYLSFEGGLLRQRADREPPEPAGCNRVFRARAGPSATNALSRNGR
ncbi:hypothetical protein EVAR_68393_1 [Eumeta japonica]|uniref:Uncharacterized protein n=1 Tax=Eumeta variegata TaxID=151549 RepID=A0A4C2ADE1_EUMVA|nr:hypothetical protein EVAR_68393_1 [Eumeta japonica]